MKVHPSALKHGVAAEDAEQAAEWALWIEPLNDDPPRRELRLGFDTHARLLETVVLVLEGGDVFAPGGRKWAAAQIRSASSGAVKGGVEAAPEWVR